MLPFYQLCHGVKRHIYGLKYKQRLPGPEAAVQAAAQQGWASALDAVRQSEHKYVVINVAFGLGNRLRALASGMAVAAAARRKLLVVWPLDEHCNCSYRKLFAEPLPFALLEEPVPVGELMDDPLFQAYSYMKSDESSEKNARINIDVTRHLFVRSAFVLNHHRGGWEFARAQLRSLVPAKAVASKLVADSSMLGLHVRAIFDAPRPASSGVTSKSALDAASREYGSNESVALLQWRLRGSWPNFVRRIRREPADVRFYLSADAEEAYVGLMKAFPGRIVRTLRPCAAERCDFRDAASIQLALVRCALPVRCAQLSMRPTHPSLRLDAPSQVDMLNLARTQRILGSFYSSFSEAARFFGQADSFGTQLPIEYAGVDFGPDCNRNLTTCLRNEGAVAL